jgi:hypothetical protein
MFFIQKRTKAWKVLACVKKKSTTYNNYTKLSVQIVVRLIAAGSLKMENTKTIVNVNDLVIGNNSWNVILM